MQFFLNRSRLVCVPDECRKNDGCYCKITRLCWTRSWCRICPYVGKIGGCSQIAQKFLNRNVQTFGYVFHDTNGQNHGKTLMIPWYLLNEIYMVTYYLHCYGKDNSKKLYENLGGRKYRIGNVCSFIENKGYFCQWMWMTSKLLERSRIWHPCGK